METTKEAGDFYLGPRRFRAECKWLTVFYPVRKRIQSEEELSYVLGSGQKWKKKKNVAKWINRRDIFCQSVQWNPEPVYIKRPSICRTDLRPAIPVKVTTKNNKALTKKTFGLLFSLLRYCLSNQIKYKFYWYSPKLQSHCLSPAEWGKTCHIERKKKC